MLPRCYSLVDVKKKKDKKDPILGDIESQSQSIQPPRAPSKRVPPKENNTLKKLEAKKNS